MPPNPNVSEIAVMTIENRSKMLADNMSDNCTLLMRLKASGTVRPATGGRLIFQELEYDENQTFQYYSGYEELDTRPSDVFTTAEFPWRQAVVNVSISGLEELQNAGAAAQIDLLSSRIDNAFKTMKNQICNGLYSDGTGSGRQADRRSGDRRINVANHRHLRRHQPRKRGVVEKPGGYRWRHSRDDQGQDE